MTPPVPGCAVVVLSERLGPVLPVAALPALREAAAVYSELPFDVEVPLAAPPAPDKLAAQAAVEPVVLLTLDATSPAARALGGAAVLAAPQPEGAALLDAVAVMDRLRSPGGCPWDAEQTHASLRQYLVEETYELLDAIEHAEADRAALREELGDVLLQVLFHARIAAEDAEAPFTVDDVARSLADKLVGRHPHVFAGSEQLATAAAQEVRWEELKRAEKQRASAVDGVALGQPSVALAAKLVSRTRRAGLPADLLPGVAAAGELPGPAGEALFAVAALAKLAGADPETELRSVALRFAETVRAAEDAARAEGLDPAVLPAEEWRRFFPAAGVSARPDA